MSEIYVVLINDRHVDLDVRLFTNKEAADAYAEAELDSFARHPDHIERYGDRDDDWSATWNEEGDYVRVTRREVK